MSLFKYLPEILLLINIFLLIGSFYTKLRLTNKVFDRTITGISFLYLLAFTLSFYNLSYSSNLYKNKIFTLFWYGAILFCYGLFFGFISNLINSKFINIASSVTYLIASILYTIAAFIDFDNDHFIYNVSSAFLYIFGSLFFLYSDFTKNTKIFVSIGWLLFMFGKIIPIISGYLYPQTINIHGSK
jgi:hypothetical protein